MSRHISFIVACTLIVVVGCDSTTKFGGPVTGPPVSVDEALDRRAVGRTLTVEGAIHEVCRDEGCWFTLSGSSGEITVRYTAENGLGIPVVSTGRARVRGVVRDTIIGRNRVPEIRAVGIELLRE